MTVAGPGARGAARHRGECWEKVTGRARYAAEYAPGDTLAYAVPVQSAIARGEVKAVDTEALLTLPGMLAVLWHGNAPGLGPPDDPDLALFQSPRVAHRGQFVAAVVAESLETAYEAARHAHVEYAAEPHDVILHAAHPKRYRPPKAEPADIGHGDVEKALRDAAVAVDLTYTSPACHSNPMEPHATVAVWEEQGLTLYDSCLGASVVRDVLAKLFGLPPGMVRVIAPHVGAGFGTTGAARPEAVLAALAAKMSGRPVKVALTRRQMFAVTGYRTPIVQRVRLAADPGGRLIAIAHDTVEQTSTLTEPTGQATRVTRMMYAAPNRRVTHEIVPLDVPTPSWTRAPGECPGVFALESAMDELAIACGLDPVELRIRNEPDVDPESGRPSDPRNLVACLRAGTERFGWATRDPTPGVRREGRWLVGTGVAASAYPVHRRSPEATARLEADGRFTVRIAAARIDAGTRTALTRIAADTLRTTPERVRVETGDGSAAAHAASWDAAVVRACEALRELMGGAYPGGAAPPPEARAGTGAARHAFGAQFAEVRVDADTGEVRVPRLLGVFAAGRIADPETARCRFVGAMTMGLSMTLFENSVMDERFGDFLNHDLAQYLIATSADIRDIEAYWIEDDAPGIDPMSAEGIGEIGAIGTAAAIANAVHHATGVRVRDLPIRLDRLLNAHPPA